MSTVTSSFSSISFYRLSLSILMSIVLSSSPLMAKKTQPKPEKLSDYLLTSKQLRALKPAEQARYIAFLYHFTAAIEMLDRSPKSSEYAYHPPSSSFNSYVYLSRFFTSTAQADELLIPLSFPRGSNFSKHGVVADLTKHLQPIELKPCSDKFNSPYMNKVTDKGLDYDYEPCPSKTESQLAQKNSGNIAPSSKGSSSPEEMLDTESSRWKKLGKKQPKPPAESGEIFHKAGDINSRNGSDGLTPKAVENTISAPPSSVSKAHKVEGPINGIGQVTTNERIVANSRKVGETCLFGMWLSEFKQMPDNSIKCTRPAGSDCKQSNGQPGFRCNTFGFSEDVNKVSVSKDTCIPLYSKEGLRDLTIRCVGTSKWLLESAKAVRVENYDAFIKELKEKIDQFENVRLQTKDKKRKLTFREYCKNQPKETKMELQQTECGALIGLIDELNRNIDSAGESTTFKAPTEQDGSTVKDAIAPDEGATK